MELNMIIQELVKNENKLLSEQLERYKQKALQRGYRDETLSIGGNPSGLGPRSRSPRHNTMGNFYPNNQVKVQARYI